MTPPLPQPRQAPPPSQVPISSPIPMSANNMGCGETEVSDTSPVYDIIQVRIEVCRIFLAVWDQSVCGLAASPSRLGVNGFADLPTNPAYTLRPGIPGTRRYLPFCVPPSLITRTRWYGNIHPFSIDYASRPRLRDRLTLT